MNPTQLSAEDFLAKFPNPPLRTGCLEDLACPNCGDRDHIKVTALVELAVSEDGTSEEGGDHEYEDQSPARCAKCQHRGFIRDFTVPDLDALLFKNEA